MSQMGGQDQGEPYNEGRTKDAKKSATVLQQSYMGWDTA